MLTKIVVTNLYQSSEFYVKNKKEDYADIGYEEEQADIDVATEE